MLEFIETARFAQQNIKTPYLDREKAHTAQLKSLDIDNQHATFLGQNQHTGWEIHRCRTGPSCRGSQLSGGEALEVVAAAGEGALSMQGTTSAGAGVGQSAAEGCGVGSSAGAAVGGVGVEQLDRHSHAVLQRQTN